jgi:cytochrome o ubiquinol oxidase subunit 1
MPRNTPLGFFVAFFAVVFGFGMIWHIWWMGILGLVGILAVCTWYGWQTDVEEHITAEEIAEFDRGSRQMERLAV